MTLANAAPALTHDPPQRTGAAPAAATSSPGPFGRHLPGRGLAGEAIIALLVAALGCAFYASLAWYGFDLLEEGYFLTHARRVQLGGLPYRDFSTPYTPGIFYLYAWLMDRFQADLVTLRLLSVAARAVTFVALYGAARLLMPAAFALLTPLVMVAMDTAPELWGIHPGWMTSAPAMLAVLAVARYVVAGGAGWLLVAGALSGLAFVFKQNLAAYGLIAALWFLVVAERRLPPLRLAWKADLGPRVARLALAARVAVQVAALVLLPLTAAVIVRPYLSSLVALLYIAPLLALSALAAATLLRRGDESPAAAIAGQGAFFIRPALLLAGFGAVTLPWLVVLVVALEGRVELLGGFVGRIDPTGYFFGMKPYTAEHGRLVAAALLPALVVVAAARAGLWGRRGAAVLLGALVCVSGAAMAGAAAASDATEPWSVIGAVQGLFLAAGNAWQVYGQNTRPTDDLILYLPVLAFWGELVAWLLGSGDGPQGTLRLWYLAAGAALFLNQYPRMDQIHLLWSAGPLLVVGADVLYGLYRRAVSATPTLWRSASGRVALGLSLAILPAVACLPTVWWRLAAWSAFSPPLAADVHAARPGAQERLAPLDLPYGGRVWLREADARPVAEVVDLLQTKTAPGERVFTYPAIPGFVYLADRPAAVRYLHLFPGMAAATEQADLVRQLEGVNYVVWDDGGAHYWVRPGDNAPLTEYVRANFRVERFIGPYAVLARDAAGPSLPYTIPAGPAG